MCDVCLTNYIFLSCYYSDDVHSKNTDFSCLLCRAETEWKQEKAEKEQPLPPFDFTKLKSVTNGESHSYEEIIEKFMDQNFSNIENRIYLHPQLYKPKQLKEYHKIKNVTKADKTDEIKSNHVDSKVFTDICSSEAVSEVAKKLCCWARRNNYNGMCVFRELKFHDYLSDIKKSKSTKMYYFDGEHDIIALSFNLGVISIQVKYTSLGANIKTITQAIQKAWKQALKDEDAFTKMNRDLDYYRGVSFYRFIAITTLKKETLEKFSLCFEHRTIVDSFVFLEEHMPSNQEFDHVLDTRFSSKQSQFIFNQKQFKQLCGRYIGANYSVSTIIKTVSEQVESYCDPCKYYETCNLLLTPDQKRILDQEAPIQLMTGDYGTGESQMLEIMIHKLLKTKTNERASCLLFMFQ